MQKMAAMDDAAIIDWIREGLATSRKSKGGLAQALGGKSGSAVTAILKGERQVKAFELPIIAGYLGVPLPGELSAPELTPVAGDLVPVRVAGTVQAGSFREVDEFVQTEFVTIYETRDPQFPDARLGAFNVAGDSMNNLKPRPILPGDRVITIDFDDLRGRVPLRDGMIVVVEQVRDGGHLREWSVKQIEFYDDRIEFHPRSTNPRHKPIVVAHDPRADDGRSVRVLALVRGIRSEVAI
jgi:hypothetical protein